MLLVDVDTRNLGFNSKYNTFKSFNHSKYWGSDKMKLISPSHNSRSHFFPLSSFHIPYLFLVLRNTYIHFLPSLSPHAFSPLSELTGQHKIIYFSEVQCYIHIALSPQLNKRNEYTYEYSKWTRLPQERRILFPSFHPKVICSFDFPVALLNVSYSTYSKYQT